MDRHTIVVIIVTATVTTTITIVVGWILNFFKAQVANTLIEKAKTNVGKKVLKLILYGFFLAIDIRGFLHYVLAPGYPTRGEVVLIVMYLMGIFIFSASISGDLYVMSYRRKLEKSGAHFLN